MKELHEDQETIFKLIGALQVAGLDECNSCHQWSKDFLVIQDRCRCSKCMVENPTGILDEDLTEDYEGAKMKVVQFFTRRGIQIKFTGELLETYKQLANRRL